MLIRNCSIEGKTGRFNVRISGDKITEITQFSASLEPRKSEEVFEADGALLTSALAEPHAHLDKAFLSERIANPTGDLMGAINAMEANRHLITVADTIERAERAVRLMASNGVTAIRTHADVTEWNSLDAVEALLEVRNRTKDQLICKFVRYLAGPSLAMKAKKILNLVAEQSKWAPIF